MPDTAPLPYTAPRPDQPAPPRHGRACLIRPLTDTDAPPLIDRITGAAGAAGARRLMLWTDTRFTQAHAFYEALGFVRAPGTRALDDISRSVEYRYDLPLSPAGQS